eukprot:13577026-Alexandrium_andersonii.AAC.1
MGRETAAEHVATWIDTQGRALGFRTPTASERARALGLETYLVALNLPRRALYDAEGNSFDYMAVAVRLAGM